ncbi:MAG TPA: fibronectin type III domain-containing protein [Acidimicrobiales bacterium]
MTGQTTTHGGRRNVLARAAVAVVGAAVLTAGLSTGAGATSSLPSIRPTVPLQVTVTPGPGQLVVSWSPPAYNGDWVNRFGQVVPYVITDYDLKGVPRKTWATCVDTTLSCTLTGLKVGKTYDISVKVWNAKGRHSPFTTPVSVTYSG